MGLIGEKTMLKLRNLRAVQTVATTGSVSQAARLLNLSQPAITHAVKRIEEQLGIVLFERQFNGMKLTAVGEIVTSRIERSLQQLSAAEREITETTTLKRSQKNSLSAIQRSINYTHLSTLVEVSNCMNVSYAAKRIGVSEPVIYRCLREIEDIVGESIFHRRINFATTPVGEIMVRRAKLVFAELQHMRDEIKQFYGKVAGKVIIGTLPSSRTTLVPRAIAQLSEEYPGLEFSMIDKPYDDMLARLTCGEIDVIVGSVRHPSHVLEIEEEVLFQEPVAIFARSGHPLMGKRSVNISDLARASWVLPRKGTPTRDYLESLFRRHDLSPPTDFVETDSLIAIRALLTENDRLTIISPNRAYFEWQIGLLDIVPFDVSDMSFSFGYTVRSQALLSPGGKVFINKLRQLGSDQVFKINIPEKNIFGLKSLAKSG